MSDTIQEVGREKPDWLAALEHDPADGPRVHRVGELLPPGYAVYLRLFHPFLPWGVDPYSADESQRRTWKSLAVEAGATFGSELMWRSLEPVIPIIEGGGRRYQVAEGDLDPSTRRRLFSVLSAHTRSQPLYFFYGLSTLITGHGPILFRADIDSVEQVVALARSERFSTVESPEAVWPEDRSWVFFTDYDLVSTYIACNRTLGSALAADDRLETCEVSRDTRIDDNADNPNVPPGSP